MRVFRRLCDSLRESASCVSSIGWAFPTRCVWRRVSWRAKAQGCAQQIPRNRDCYIVLDPNDHTSMWRVVRSARWKHAHVYVARESEVSRVESTTPWSECTPMLSLMVLVMWPVFASLALVPHRFVTVDVASVCQVKLPDACGAGWSPKAL